VANSNDSSYSPTHSRSPSGCAAAIQDINPIYKEDSPSPMNNNKMLHEVKKMPEYKYL
jgi:hypothetical protein